MYNFEKKSPTNVKISFCHISVHGGHIGKTNYIITKLDNFNFSYLMNGTTDFNS